jgi:hypothetical protein
MEKLMEWTLLAGETEVLGENLPDATLFTKNPIFQTQARTRAAAVGSQRLTASVMARPYFVSSFFLLWESGEHIRFNQGAKGWTTDVRFTCFKFYVHLLTLLP